jgi:hypothetical protein
MIVRPAPQWPVVFPLGLADRGVINAGDAEAHETVLVKFPILIAIGAEPVSGIIVPFVGKSHGDTIFAEGPKLLDQAIAQFLVPFAGQELHDRVASLQKFRAIAPYAVRRVGESHPLGIACVPTVFRRANFLRRGLCVKGWQWRSGQLHGVVWHCVKWHEFKGTQPHLRIVRATARGGLLHQSSPVLELHGAVAMGFLF